MVGQLHLLLLMNFKQTKKIIVSSLRSITMPLRVRKGSTSAAGDFIFFFWKQPQFVQQSLPPISSSSSSSLQCKSSQPDKHRCPVWWGNHTTGENNKKTKLQVVIYILKCFILEKKRGSSRKSQALIWFVGLMSPRTLSVRL